ncbi:glycosyl transferase family 1 [Gordoniibacillus kamchatkensis]|uniref:Glycosyl transferase family 1 n=1 Tax=Gordoniibacillus kamchatkensis TaxID=1590651 RepID=A0ABR5AGM6_9BACL|nr:glycosyltransferase family 4 protein [Paenibacillus sp. VKM B-2647]KIL40214.1 glycosyl transferase family 1 [Paenibacillus sp. VKM B-2647]
MREIGILTHSFTDAYNGNTDKIYGGGLERYLYDLSGVVKELGCRPVIHQLSASGSFRTELEGIRVIGYDCKQTNLVEAFNRMSAEAGDKIVYSSFIWEPIDYKQGSIGICHGINWDHPGFSPEHKSNVARNVQNALSRLKRIVSVDSHFVTFCRAVCSFDDPERVVLLPNAVDTEEYVPADKEKSERDCLRILYPRRISIERGIVPMMLAADRLLASYPHVAIEFAGEVIEDSLLTKAFRLWLGAHPHRNRIRHQAYTFAQMKTAYQRADIAVIPTIFSEGTSFSCLEALSCGLPVVSANVGGLNDLIIDGFNGLLVSPTEDKIYEAISSLVENEQLRRSLGREARATARAFDKAIWKRKWRTIIADFMESP